MSEMVERVAVVLATIERAKRSSIKPEDNPNYAPFWVAVARAAIASMREPTEALSEAMNAHASNGTVDWRDLHNAMIDEVLKD